jgi:hypothetical protein
LTVFFKSVACLRSSSTFSNLSFLCSFFFSRFSYICYKIKKNKITPSGASSALRSVRNDSGNLEYELFLSWVFFETGVALCCCICGVGTDPNPRTLDEMETADFEGE